MGLQGPPHCHSFPSALAAWRGPEVGTAWGRRPLTCLEFPLLPFPVADVHCFRGLHRFFRKLSGFFLVVFKMFVGNSRGNLMAAGLIRRV